MLRMSILKSLAVASLLALIASAAFAQPPPHARAHGYRAKHMGHTGVEWEVDYGITAGKCDRQAVATVVGGIVGGVIANRIADSDNRKIATLIGAAAGALIGNRIGRELDEADQACVGHALELGKTGQTVSWENESTGVRYELVPGRGSNRDGASCREFNFVAVAGSDRSARQGLACQSEVGTWEIVQ